MKPPHWFPLLISAVPVLLAWSPLHATTTVHNNGFTASNQALPSSPNYASNVSVAGPNWNVSAGAGGITGTPGIALVWDGEGGGGNNGANGGFDTYTNWDGRGNVVQLDSSGPGGTANFFISFVPVASSQVKIVSFDLDEWNGGGAMAVDWSIRDATKTGTILASGNWTRSTGGRDTIAPAYTGATGQTLVLQLTRTSGDGTYLALDNLEFDEVSTAASIVSFTSLIDTLDGQPFPLDWIIANPAAATSLTLSDGVTTTDLLPLTSQVDGTGSIAVNPAVTTTYTLTLDGSSTREVTILSGRAISLSSSATVATAPAHQVTLSWLVQAAQYGSVTISDGVTVHDVTALTDGSGSGTADFTVPAASTDFVLQVNGSPVTATRQVLREQAASGDFSLASSAVTVGSPVTVNWANAAAGPTDWIGIYRIGDTPGVQLSTQWNYLNGTRTAGGSVPAGTMDFTGLPAGDYYVCLLLDDAYGIAQGPLVFSVMEPVVEPPDFRVVKVERTGNQVTLEWESQPGLVYEIRASDSLAGDPLTEWTLVADDITAEAGATTQFTEDLGASPPAQRFYRVFSEAAP